MAYFAIRTIPNKWLTQDSEGIVQQVIHRTNYNGGTGFNSPPPLESDLYLDGANLCYDVVVISLSCQDKSKR